MRFTGDACSVLEIHVRKTVSLRVPSPYMYVLPHSIHEWRERSRCVDDESRSHSVWQWVCLKTFIAAIKIVVVVKMST